MRHFKLIGLCIVAVLATCLAVVGEASAEPEHIFRVNGAKLEAGKVKEITAKAKTDFTITGTGPLGVTWELKCKKLKLGAAEKPSIVGGTPGRSEKERFEFEECTATLGGAKCEKVAVEVASLSNELATIVAPAAKAGELAVVFSPASGTTFIAVTLSKCGIFGTIKVTVEGTSAASVSPAKTEVSALTLVWNQTEEITEVRVQDGAISKVGLKSGGTRASISGEMEVELVSKEKWGAF